MPEKKGYDRKEPTYRARLEGLAPGEQRPEIAVTAVDRDGKPLHVAGLNAEGEFQLPAAALEAAHRIVVGPKAEEGATIDPRTVLRYRPAQFQELLGTAGVLDIASRYWQAWHGHVTCVTGSVRRCRPIWWWVLDKVRAFNVPVPRLAGSESATELAESRFPSLREKPRRRASIKSVREALNASRIEFTPPWSLRCAVVCNGTVEVYRRTCCCHRDWFVTDPRLPKLIRELEALVRSLDQPVIVPWPPLPDPPPDFSLAQQVTKLPFLREGALDEKTLNARQDLAAIRSLPAAEAAAYIRARSYLWWCSCGRPRKVGQGPIHPDGTFSICWWEFLRLRRARCYDQYAYVVKQVINGVTVTIYNGPAANIWFDQTDDAELTTYSPWARVCRDNGARDDAYVYLELIGDTEAWHLKTPNSTAWDRVAAPAFNDGLAFPSTDPAAATAPYDRNWGGVLKLYFKFSEGLRDVGAKYYRLSVTAADASGNPIGPRTYIGEGLSWEKSVGGGVTVPVSLGPVPPVGGQNNLYLIPYDHDADWDADQYHAYLNTNRVEWSDPEVRHLLTLEVFDDTGRRLRPNGTPATGQPGLEIEAPFTYRRQFQDLGPSANVPFGALTHMFWWDNRPVFADLESLIRNGLVYNAECQYLQGQADSTFSVGYRAYHENPLFHDSHSVWWYRGSGATAEHQDTLTLSAFNVGKPPDPAGVSGSTTFAEMLRTNLDPSRLKCSFVVYLSVGVKTFDGENTLAYLNGWDAWAFSVEINS